MMWYVYLRSVETGREEFLNSFPAVKDAVRFIADCYHDDIKRNLDGDFYYFMKKH